VSRQCRRRPLVIDQHGLLPAALAFGASTTQDGFDIAVTFGFYPGISTKDGSPKPATGRRPAEYRARDHGNRYAAVSS
jgi:hypothetical protein